MGSFFPENISFDFDTASTTWVCNHGISNRAVGVSVAVWFEGNLTQCLPLDIVHSGTTVTVTFPSPQTGRVRIV